MGARMGAGSRLRIGSSAANAGTNPETLMLWVLVALEMLAHVGLRRYYRRHHGG